jgi:raffinose synthase
MIGGVTLFDELDSALRLELVGDAAGFLHVSRESAAARFKVTLGGCRDCTRFLACHRYEPFWMKPATGRELVAVPVDTQFLLLELRRERFAIVVPLVDGPFKVSLSGAPNGLTLTLDSGDPEVRGTSALAAFVAVGSDPHLLCREGAEAVARRLGTRLRREKALPAFVDDFGWCTWDAFYQDVSPGKLREGLTTFRDGGVTPKALILDDGWQSLRTPEGGAGRLASFAANAKFPGDLRPVVDMAKREFGVRRLLVWHAVHGYWGGVDGEALAGYGVSDTLRWYSPEVLSHCPAFNWEYWGPTVGRPTSQGLAAFFDDYHRHLAAQGVDGVKVDNQASVEGLSVGQGGRVAFMRATRRALEASVRRHFDGALINCMSCASEMLYQADDSTVTRTSTDFWPNLPASHGAHVYTNAAVGLWFGELVHPDWDMFQSGHEAGAFHAAARAVSGSPIYVSDKPGEHDFALLRQLVTSDGSTLRPIGVGVPARDSLFTDPLKDAVLFKVVNHNRFSWLVGVFNARYVPGSPATLGSVAARDVPGIAGERFVLHLQREGRLEVVEREQATELWLPVLGSEVATFAPLQRGVAVIGLADKLNPGGAVTRVHWQGRGELLVELCDGGDFLAFVAERPRRVLVDGAPLAHEWSRGRLALRLDGAGPHRVLLEL